jgi:hypothetical protein
MFVEAAEHALSDVQDYVSLITGDPWPRVGTGYQPRARARVEGGRVEMWFGDERQPVLVLRPIVLG